MSASVEQPKPQSAILLSKLAVNRNQTPKRRSVRMALSVGVGLSGEDLVGAFTVAAKASNLNKHGAAIQLNRDLPVGSTVVVRNKYGAQVSARVVAQVSAADGVRCYGIEFLEQSDSAKNFWGINFPPA